MTTYGEPATEKQVNYMKGLGIEVPQGCSKIDAKKLIEAKVGFKAGGNNDIIYTPTPIPSKILIPAEDTDRQRLIVRQSCLKAAIELYPELTLVSEENEKEILEIAEKFEEWVFR